jgi:probable rRNA maturation factor
MPGEPDSRSSTGAVSRSSAGAVNRGSTQGVDGERPLWLSLDILHEAGDWSLLGDRDALITAAGLALARDARFASHPAAEVCVALSDDATVRELNARFRGKDKPTNVLSFPSLADFGGPGSVPMIGDIVLAQETVEREAAEQDIALAHHLQHLVVHGLLHLLDYDHETEDDAQAMESLEVEILATLGIPNPYSGELTLQSSHDQ